MLFAECRRQEGIKALIRFDVEPCVHANSRVVQRTLRLLSECWDTQDSEYNDSDAKHWRYPFPLRLASRGVAHNEQSNGRERLTGLPCHLRPLSSTRVYSSAGVDVNRG